MSRLIVACSVAAGLFLSGHAVAADIGVADPVAGEPPLGTSDWVVQVTPYLWASGIDGDISPFRLAPTIHVEKSFSDVLEDLNMGGFLNVWARHGDFVLSGDLMYVNTTAAKAVGALPVVGALPHPLDASVDTIEFNAALQGGYRVVDQPQFTLDLLAGGRFWYVSNEVNVAGLTGGVSLKANFSWVDPLVGARAFYRLTDRVSLMGQADIGDFGAGSDLTWSVLGTVNYAFNDRLSVSAGYKHLSVDYDRDGHVFDVDMSGPVLGMTYRFN